MADIVDKKTRSKMMAGIKGKNTKPEMLIRKALFAKGLRYRLHDKNLPGKPDLVFPKYKAVIFVQGCFWHGHDCHLFKWPTSNKEYWRNKINRNREVDKLKIVPYTGLTQKQHKIYLREAELRSTKALIEHVRNDDDWSHYPAIDHLDT